MKDKMVLKKNPDMVTRRIDDETILVPIFRTSEEMNCIYTLNPIAGIAWDLIDGKKNLTQIKQRLLKRFGSTQEEVNKEMAQFIKDLKKIKAVI